MAGKARAAAKPGGLGKGRNAACRVRRGIPSGLARTGGRTLLQILAGPPARLRFASRPPACTGQRIFRKDHEQALGRLMIGHKCEGHPRVPFFFDTLRQDAPGSAADGERQHELVLGIVLPEDIFALAIGGDITQTDVHRAKVAIHTD